MGKEKVDFADAHRFLDTVSLGVLVSPVTEDEFRARYWEKAPLILHRNNPYFYGDFFSLEDFDRAVASGPATVKVADAKAKKVTSNEGDKTDGLERTLNEMRGGATLALDGLHMREPKLALLCRVLEQQLGHYFQVNAYLTPPNGQGFTPHYDSHDVFVMQVYGSKRWKLEKSRRKFPGKNEDKDGANLEMDAQHHAFTLNQGDMIYIPRGFVHAAECGSEPSLHLTLGLIPCTWDDLLRVVLKATVAKDPRLLKALPLGFLHGGPDGLVKRLMAALQETVDEKFLTAVVDQYRDELVSKFPLDISGQITDFFKGITLTTEDLVGARRGIVYRVSPTEEFVRLNFGARSITFPILFGEALDFALKTPVFAIKELPGELECEEKLAFIERLMQEGLVVRT